MTVEPIRGEPQTISTDEIAEPDLYGSFDVRDRDRSVRQVEVPRGEGIAIDQLLEAAGAKAGYRTVEITRPNGRTLRLSRDQIEDPDAPALVYTDEAGVTWLLRLLPGTDKLYAADQFAGSQTLILRAQTRSPITVEVTASPEEIAAGESVTFEVSTPGAPPGTEYVFHWNFRDGSDPRRSRKRELTHKFEKAGSYPVLVSASTDSESSQPEEVEVTVGEPKESEKDRSGGGEATGGGPSGLYDGSSSGGSSGSTTPYSPSYTPPAPAPYKPVPTTPPSTLPSTPSKPGIATDGSFVEGNLLADAGDPPSGSILESAARAAREGTPRESEESGGGVPEVLLSLLAALALLGLGAALELRQGPTLRLRRG